MMEKSTGEPLAKTLKTDVDGAFAMLTAFTPLKRISTPDEIGGICSYLASDDSSFVTGSCLLIDGGAHVVDPNGSAIASAGLGWGG
jgi:enoyl-[acyl-carrier-protein] reductase (NADH)